MTDEGGTEVWRRSLPAEDEPALHAVEQWLPAEDWSGWEPWAEASTI